MNDLSWMIYAADVAESYNIAAIPIVMFSAFGAALLFAMSNSSDFGDAERDKFKRYSVRLAGLAVFASFLGIAVPSQSTIYAIAASEMGETALNTETGGKAVEALNAWLDRQIDGEAQ